jgi:SAM-dependent methyltransferase
MNETTKSKKYWTDLEWRVLTGVGIDIGCATDAVVEGVRRFDLEHGDANRITQFVHEQFDFVYSSHCLEHMHDPALTIQEWWKLVKPGGYLFFIVPDEDLYEQGVFPSRFNSDHKATFTISKVKSWSPKSYNVYDLAKSLPESKIVKLALQDRNYDRAKASFGNQPPPFYLKLIFKVYTQLKSYLRLTNQTIESLLARYFGFDQLKNETVLAQIECIIRKNA